MKTNKEQFLTYTTASDTDLMIYVESGDAVAGVFPTDVGSFEFVSCFIELEDDITPLSQESFTSIEQAIERCALFLKHELMGE
jgi:hypothetical protein